MLLAFPALVYVLLHLFTNVIHDSMRSGLSPLRLTQLSDAERTNMDRRRHVEEYCRRHGSRGQLPIDQILIVEDLNVLFCAVPKAASTSLKSFFLTTAQNLNSAQSNEVKNSTLARLMDTVHKFDTLKKYGINRLSEYPPKTIPSKLKTLFKFMVVRDPVERLFSGYKDKILSDLWYKPHLRPYIIDHYRYGRNTSMQHYLKMFRQPSTDAKRYLPPFPEGSRFKVTFTEYLKYVVDTMSPEAEIRPDIHILGAGHLCKPCLVGYDYIAKTDTLEEDFKEIVGHLQFSRRKDLVLEKTNSNHKCTRTDQNISCTDAGANREVIPQRLLQDIRNLYAEDIDMFGY